MRPDSHRWHAVWSHRDQLLRVARRRVPNAMDAEDCVSEAMLRAAAFAGLDVERAGAFLTAVTVRLCADVHRDTGREVPVATAPEAVEPSEENAVCDRAEAAWLAGLAGAALTERELAALRRRAGWPAPPATTGKAEAMALARARTKLRPLLTP
jgi:DNA-directed RNA polymerase specialized sigma24 family protein